MTTLPYLLSCFSDCSNYQNSWKATIFFFHNNCFCCWPSFFIHAVYFVMATHKILIESVVSWELLCLNTYRKTRETVKGTLTTFERCSFVIMWFLNSVWYLQISNPKFRHRKWERCKLFPFLSPGRCWSIYNNRISSEINFVLLNNFSLWIFVFIFLFLHCLEKH